MLGLLRLIIYTHAANSEISRDSTSLLDFFFQKVTSLVDLNVK